MKKNLTDITVLLDRSGSMNSCRSDVIGGLNEFIDKQKKVDGECLFTLIQFDSVNSQEVTYSAVNVHSIARFSNFEPRGGTPLLDAMGASIINTGARLRAMPESERPGKVIFVVITDGYENASKEYKKSQIASLVKEQTDRYSWDFIFLGANMDAIAEGASVGFAFSNTANFSVHNIGATISATGMKAALYRSSNNKVDLAYTSAERKSFVDDKDK